jgi:hypothetical protein
MVAGSWIRGLIVTLAVVVAGGASAAERVLRPVAPDGCVDDSWEYDDESPGAELRVGTTQRRRLCDEDWAYFSFDSGSRYQVETGRLRGGADSAIELWICNVAGFDEDGGCDWRLASDDNGGVDRGRARRRGQRGRRRAGAARRFRARGD